MVGGASSDSSRFGRYVSLKIAPELEFYVDPTARTKPSLEGASEIGMTRGLRRWLRLVESFDLIYYSSSGSLRFGRTSRLKFAAELGFSRVFFSKRENQGFSLWLGGYRADNVL